MQAAFAPEIHPSAAASPPRVFWRFRVRRAAGLRRPARRTGPPVRENTPFPFSRRPIFGVRDTSGRDTPRRAVRNGRRYRAWPAPRRHVSAPCAGLCLLFPHSAWHAASRRTAARTRRDFVRRCAPASPSPPARNCRALSRRSRPTRSGARPGSPLWQSARRRLSAADKWPRCRQNPPTPCLFRPPCPVAGRVRRNTGTRRPSAVRTMGRRSGGRSGNRAGGGRYKSSCAGCFYRG